MSRLHSEENAVEARVRDFRRGVQKVVTSFESTQLQQIDHVTTKLNGALVAERANIKEMVQNKRRVEEQSREKADRFDFDQIMDVRKRKMLEAMNAVLT